MGDINQLLAGIKADLIERRLWIVLVALGVALVAAVVLLGGGSSATGGATTGAQAPGGSAPGSVGPRLAPAPLDPNAALAETDNGGALQRAGGAHDPFTALVLPGTHRPAPKSSGGSGSGSGGGAGSGSGSGSGGGNTVPTPSTPTPPSSPPPSKGGGGKSGSGKSVKLNLELRLGVVQALVGPDGGPTGPSGTTGPQSPSGTGQTAPPFPTTGLQDYTSILKGAILPSSKDALVRVASVSSDGATVALQLATQLFVAGEGRCVPTPTNCTSLTMKQGDWELLQYLSPATNTLVAYELVVVSVAPTTASGASLPANHSRSLGSLAKSARAAVGGGSAVAPIRTWGVIAGGAPWAPPHR